MQRGWHSLLVWESFPSREKRQKVRLLYHYLTRILWVYTVGKVLLGLQDAETSKAWFFFFRAHNVARESDMLNNYDIKWWVLWEREGKNAMGTTAAAENVWICPKPFFFLIMHCNWKRIFTKGSHVEIKIVNETGFTLSEQTKMVKEYLSNLKPKQNV